MNIKELRTKYESIVGKRPFNGWKEAELIVKIEAFEADSRPSEAAHPTSLPKGGPPVSDHVASVQAKREESPSSVAALNNLYWQVGDGSYRRKIKDIMLLNPEGKDLINALDGLRQFVKEGELKAVIQSIINTI